MGLLDDIKAKADINGDGKITKEDLEALAGSEHKNLIDKLQAVADQNDDGKLNLEDVKNLNLGDVVQDIKDSFLGAPDSSSAS